MPLKELLYLTFSSTKRQKNHEVVFLGSVLQNRGIGKLV